MKTTRSWLVVAATGVVAGVCATQVDWTAPVDRAPVPGPTLAAPSSPGAPVPISPAVPVTHATPAVEEIAADVDTTGLLQPLDAAALDEAATGMTDDALQGD